MLVIPPSTRNKRRERQSFTPNRPRPEAPVLIVGAAVAGNVLTLTFDQPVSLSGVPAFTIPDAPAAAAVSASKTGPTVVAITYGQSIEGALSVNVGFRDPAIRGSSGGYVTSVISAI